jgi:hypothetical protein
MSEPILSGTLPPTDTMGLGRRRHRRQGWDCEVKLAWVRPDGTLGPWSKVMGDDISLGGMAVSGAMEFPRGALGVVELPASEEKRAMVGFRVVHSEKRGPMHATAGVEFVQVAARLAGAKR